MMSKTFERYRERFKPFDLKCKSGFTWRVRRMQAEDWPSVAGGLLTLPKAPMNGSGATNADAALAAAEAMRQAEIESQARYRQMVYEHLVVGLVDDETGDVVRDEKGDVLKPAYAEVGSADISEIVDWQLSDSFSSTEAAQEAGRSLR